MMVALVLPVLIGFGIWQIARAEWKEAVLADIAAAADAPMVVIRPGVFPDGLQFRQVSVALDCPRQVPMAEAGRSRSGKAGWAFVLDCTGPDGQVLHLVAGWAARADQWPMADARAGDVAGMLVPGTKVRWRLVANSAPAGLEPVAPPGPDSIPNNHISYAIQWFSFAAILVVIYGLWLRRRLASLHRPA